MKEKNNQEIQFGIEKLSGLLKADPASIPLLEERAELYIKLQQFGLAINDFRAILSIDNSNKKAEIRIEQLQTILKYQNTDIFENPNTNFDPWLD
jgi:predicted Zn-dependent protease